MASTYSRRDVDPLLEALDRSATEVIETARNAASDAKAENYQGYAAFKKKADDFDTLAILIEHRLKNLRLGRDKELEERFDELVLFMLSATITTSLHFLRILSERQALPLGSKELFAGELRSLHRANEKIAMDRFSQKLAPRTRTDMRIASEILSVILDRAPSLLDLGRT